MSGPVPAEPGPRCVNPECRKPRKRRTGQPGYEGGRDYCRSCYDRARDAGFPAVVPAQRRAGDGLAARLREQDELAAERRERFAWLRDDGWSVAECREDLWVSQRTAERYERWYLAQRVVAA